MINDQLTVHIRKAVKEDCVRLMELVNELALYEKAPQEVTVTLEEFEDAGFGENPVWNALVAEVEGLVVGFALYNQLILEAKDKGYSGMVWQVLDWNEPAINFYNKYDAHIETGWWNVALSKEQLQQY